MAKKLSETVSTGTIQGTYDPKFEQVAEQFVENFTKNGELGASTAITIEGETVLDLWGGCAEKGTDRPWEKDTVSIVWSTSKGATAMAVHMLVTRGIIDLDAPVTKYWPEFGKKGKEKITTRMILAHQTGISAISAPVKEKGFYDWNYMIKLIEEQDSFFEMEKVHGYAGLMFGFMLGEIVRRVTGKTIGTFIQEEISQPLNLDLWMGLPDPENHSIAKVIYPDPAPEGSPISDFYQKAADPSTVQALLFNCGGYFTPDANGYDTEEAYKAEIPAAGMITNARSLAKMFTPLALGGTYKGKEYVDSDSLARMIRTASAALDDTLCIQVLFSLGFFKSIDNRNREPINSDSLIMGQSAFGHSGFGGSVGFADPEERMGFGYTMNQMGQGTLLNERGQGLVDAAYKSLGYRSNRSGVWIK